MGRWKAEINSDLAEEEGQTQMTIENTDKRQTIIYLQDPCLKNSEHGVTIYHIRRLRRGGVV